MFALDCITLLGSVKAVFDLLPATKNHFDDVFDPLCFFDLDLQGSRSISRIIIKGISKRFVLCFSGKNLVSE